MVADAPSPGGAVIVQGDLHGWIFYRKPKWFHLWTKYIDTEKTIFINNIRENDVIICNRVS